ncbi:2Fe-2S iron-sulfur cluster-binding protein [Acidithiobacillus sp. AC3]
MIEHEIVLEPSGTRFRIREDQSIVEAALEQGIAIHHGCGNGSCGDCKGTILEGEITQLPFMPLLLTPEERASGKAILCKAQPRSSLRIAAMIDTAEQWQGRVESLCLLGETVMELIIQCDRPYPYRAGQYARLKIPGETNGWRSYSMANAPREDQRLHFHIRRVPGGKFSEWLFTRAQIGDEIVLSGAQGDFYLRTENERPLLCIAAGTGLAPIEAILEESRKLGWKRSTSLFFGVRSRRDLYHLDVLEELRQERSELRLSVSCSDPELLRWSGPRRLLPAVAAEGHWQEHEVYLCGSPGMVEAVTDLLLSHGVPHEQIHFDSFSPSA